jgi:REP element-mobilizing transposase RayT
MGGEMPRQARKLSKTGIYHIVFRGVSHCLIFEEDEDFKKLLELVGKVKEELSLKILAYCFMDNHVHLVVKEQSQGDVVQAMRKLLSTYAFWFNRKYHRIGTLFANRYKSECVESDGYLLALVRYIHQNPLTAGMIKDISSYRYSSYNDYINAGSSLVDTSLMLGMLASEDTKAVQEFVSFHKIKEERDFSLFDKRDRPESHIRQEIEGALGPLHPSAVGSLAKPERDKVLSMLRKKGFTILQIERATGVSRGIISRCHKM